MLKFVIFSLLIWITESSRILGIFPTPCPDNFAIGSRLMDQLAKKGHEITFVTAPNMEEHSNPELTYVYIENELNVLQKFNSSFMDRTGAGFIKSTYHYFNSAYDVTEALLTDANFNSLIQDNKKFDLIITEFSANEALLGFTAIIKAPIVLVSPLPASSLMADLFANPVPASYVPNILTRHTGSMSYFDRMHNLICDSFVENYRYWFALTWQEKLLHMYIDDSQSISDVIENISVILLNSHSSVTEAVSHTPNMIEVGGMHINSPKKLPIDLDTFMSDAEYGVIYVSMDRNLNIDNLGIEKFYHILGTFSRLKQRIVWNFENEARVPPNNVKFVQKLLHEDIIGHPKMKAVIIDGNLLRIMEAVHFGVPIIGIPLFAEQKSNMARIVQDKYGIEIHIDELTGEKLNDAIKDIFENPEYQLNVKNRSRVMNDRLISPIDTAVYWVEFVIRHGGAKPFQSPGVHLPLYKRRLIDIIIVLTIIDIVIFLIAYYIFKHIIHCGIRQYKNRKTSKYEQLDNVTE